MTWHTHRLTALWPLTQQPPPCLLVASLEEYALGLRQELACYISGGFAQIPVRRGSYTLVFFTASFFRNPF